MSEPRKAITIDLEVFKKWVKDLENAKKIQFDATRTYDGGAYDVILSSVLMNVREVTNDMKRSIR